MSQQTRRQYKYTHLDDEELRKRREDMSISLRKQKREEHVIYERKKSEIMKN